MTHLPICTILGAGPGMGLALAKQFGRGGYHIVLVARNKDKLASLEQELLAENIAVTIMGADLSVPAQVASLFSVIHQELGPTEVLIYNAAAYRMGGVHNTSPEDLAADLALSVGGALAAVQQVLPHMEQKGSGALLFTGGSTAMTPMPGALTLGIGKAALRNLALALHQELKDKGVLATTVTICGPIAPGTYFDPATIAKTYWQLHKAPKAAWKPELLFK